MKKYLSAMFACGLVAALAAAEEPPTKGGKATVHVVGQFTADKGTTLAYALKRGGKVLAEEKGLTALPGKAIEIDAADAMAPLELWVSATGGALKITKLGLTGKGGGKDWQANFGGKLPDLNAKDASGTVVRAVSFPLTLEPVKAAEPQKKADDATKSAGAKKPDTTKKPDDTKKVDETKKPNETKKPDEPKKSVSEKSVPDEKKLPTAPQPKEK